MFSRSTYALDGLVKNDLGLVQLLLNLKDAIHLVWVLVCLDVGLEGGEGHRITGGGGVRVKGEELVEHLRKDLVSSQGWILIVANDDSGDALGSRVDVECEICRRPAVRGCRRGDRKMTPRDANLPCS